MTTPDALGIVWLCLPPTNVTVEPTSTFKELGLDSLDFIRFIQDLEDKLKIQIPNADAAMFRTVGQAAKWITDHQC